MQTTFSPLHTSPHFELSSQLLKTKTKLQMQVPTGLINTRVLPHTIAILEQEAPSVLETKCFNGLDLPFKEEVKNTETAHLFEHILIDHMAQEKVNAGWREATFSAVTKWNWRKNPVGLFVIDIKAGRGDNEFFHRGLLRSVELMEKIMATALVSDTSKIAQVVH